MNSSTAANVANRQDNQSIAAIVSDSAEHCEHTIDAVIRHLQIHGVQITGFRQRMIPGAETGCGARLEDIQSGKHFRITQNLGKGSTSCNIDNAAIEGLALKQCSALSKKTQLLFINRFGKQETHGHGFCAVIERALELEIPVLTVVNQANRQSWLDYGGDCVTTLPVSEATIQDWCESVISTSLSESHPR